MSKTTNRDSVGRAWQTRGQTAAHCTWRRLLGVMVIASCCGCDLFSDLQEKNEKRNAQVKRPPEPPVANPVPRVEPPPPAPVVVMIEPKKLTAEEVIGNFLRIAPHQLKDNDLKNLSGVEGLEMMTELKLSGANISYGGFKYVSQMRHLRKLDASRMRLQREAWSPIADLVNLKVLNLANSTIEDHGLACVKTLSQLEDLNLSYTGVTDQGFPQLQDLRSLTVLRISNTLTNGEGMRYLQALPLKILEANNTSFGLQGLQFIRKMGTLEELLISKSSTTDRALAGIKGCGTLRVLDISANTISDAGLKNLSGLASLEQLMLRQLPYVSDYGLAHLKKLKNLRELTLDGTKCTPSGVMKLKKLIPELTINLDGKVF